MELTFPSSDVMQKLYKGIMWYFLAPIAFVFLVIIVAGGDAFSALPRYGAPVIMCAVACYIVYVLNTARADCQGTARAFISKVALGFVLLAVASLLGLVCMMTNNVKLVLATVILLLLVTLAGYVMIARGYNDIAQVPGMRGAGLATRGMWAVIISIVAAGLILLIMNNTRPSYSYYGYGYDSSYYRMMAIYGILLYVVVLVAIGGLFALVYGTRFMVDSAEELELEAEDDENTPEPTKADTPVTPTDDATRMI